MKDRLRWETIREGYRRAGLEVPFEEIAAFALDHVMDVDGELQATEIALWWHLIKGYWPWEAGITQEVQLDAMIDAVGQGDHGWMRELVRQGK